MFRVVIKEFESFENKQNFLFPMMKVIFYNDLMKYGILEIAGKKSNLFFPREKVLLNPSNLLHNYEKVLLFP